MSNKTIIANCVMTLSESNSLSHFYLTETDWTGKCLHIGETADRVLGHLQCQKMVTCLRFVLLLFGSKWIKSKVKTLSSIKLFILLLIFLQFAIKGCFYVQIHVPRCYFIQISTRDEFDAN